jgi:hypothetical protein
MTTGSTPAVSMVVLSVVNEQCSIVRTPAAAAFAMPSVPCACAATNFPRSRASLTAMPISSALY